MACFEVGRARQSRVANLATVDTKERSRKDKKGSGSSNSSERVNKVQYCLMGVPPLGYYDCLLADSNDPAWLGRDPVGRCCSLTNW
jgi:hypothetical protein